MADTHEVSTAPDKEQPQPIEPDTEAEPAAEAAVVSNSESPDGAVDQQDGLAVEDDKTTEDEDKTATIYIPDDIPRFSQESLQKLSLGVLEKCSPELSKAKSLLTEVTENQRILIETVIQENSKFSESDALKEVTSTMEKAKVYHAKLLSIKKDMLLLHEKSAKLKKRSVKLQQQKEKELLQLELEQEKREERERQLLAQPAKHTAKSKT